MTINTSLTICYRSRWLCLIAEALLALCAAPLLHAQANPAELVAASGLSGGLIAHIGCEDGAFSAGLRTGPTFVVHALTDNTETVPSARNAVARQNLAEAVTVEHFDGTALPYIDHLVNLLVLTKPYALTAAECERVLAPHGILLIKEPIPGRQTTTLQPLDDWTVAGWQAFTKPPPPGTDEWTHFLHGPDGHVMSQDQVVGPPHHIQWIGSPRHSRSHSHLTTVNVMVTSGGRLFYIADISPTALPDDLPSRWALIARDAFNGIELWRRPLEKWQPYYVKDRNSYPADLHRRLVAVDYHVFATLSIHGPVSALDAATGDILRTYDDTDKTEDIVFDNGTLFLSINCGRKEDIDRRQMAYRHVEPQQKRLLAIEAETGKILWKKEDEETNGLMPMTLAVKDDGVYFQNPSGIIRLSRTTGDTQWQADRPSEYVRPGWSSPTLTVLDGVVVSADRQSGPDQQVRKDQYAAGGFSTGDLVVFAADSGKQLWTAPCAEGCRAPTDVFSVGEKLWFGKSLERRVHEYRQAHDIETGEVISEAPESDKWPSWHHHRCYRDKATVNYVLAGRTGIEFIDLRTGEVKLHNWLRGNCKFGIMPANGLLYLPPEQCGCYIESKLTGFHAVAPQRARTAPARDNHPLTQGPAYNKVASVEPSAADWPTFRHDPQRSGTTTTSVNTELEPAWQTDLGGILTAPVVANGTLFVAEREANTLVALDAATGQTTWTFIAGGPIDSPPTIARGLAVFGCRDGWVYALRAADGELAWRFRAAPADDKLMASGQLESVWPVHGSVLVQDDTVFFTAGRSSYIDGGMRAGKLNLQTGEQILVKTIYSRDPETGDAIRLYEPYDAGRRLQAMEMPGVLPDVLSSDGDRIWMRAVTFDASFTILPEFPAHLFSSMGFLDDSWWELSYWLYGEHMFSGRAGVAHAITLFPTARIMVCGDDEVYGYQYGYERSGKPLFIASSKTPTIKTVERRGRKRRYVEHRWQETVPLHVNALVLAGDTLFLAGPPEVDRLKTRELLKTVSTDDFNPAEPLQEALNTFTGEKGGKLVALKRDDGSKIMELTLSDIPVFDGLIAANRSLYMVTQNGRIICWR